jgi:hypothetical protein
MSSKLGAAEIRRLAVLAEADPRTVRKVLSGAPVLSLAGNRVRRVLASERLLPGEPLTSASTDYGWMLPRRGRWC